MDPEYFKEELLESQKIFEGKILNLRVDKVRLPSGQIATREIVEHFITAVVIPLTEKNEIILTKQFRLPVDQVLWEVPASRIDEGEAPLKAAQKL